MGLKNLKTALMIILITLFSANYSVLLAESGKVKFENLLAEAEKGSASAQYKLGELYEKGDGVEKSLTKALTFFEKAAMQNNAKALYKAGYYYYSGTGVEKDFKKAYEYMKLACDKELAAACANMVSLSISEKEKLDYHKKACELGYKISCASLLIEEQKFTEAEAVLKEECEKGNKKACNILNKLIKPLLDKMNKKSSGVKIEQGHILLFISIGFFMVAIIGFIAMRSGKNNEEEDQS